jgi:MFS family permease
VLANGVNEDEIGILKGLKMLSRNKNYVLLFFVFNLMYGNYSAMGAILSTITA